MACLFHSLFITQAATQLGQGRNAASVDTGTLVVESVGRMRAFRGRAWLPGKLPSGVPLENIR